MKIEKVQLKATFYCSFAPFLNQQDDKKSSLCHERCNHESCEQVCVLSGSLAYSSGDFSSESCTQHRMDHANTSGHNQSGNYTSLQII